MNEEGFIPPHGNYKELKSYQKALIIYDGTVCFCGRFFPKFDRTIDQMVQAARSGKQNIIEGCMASGTSKATEIKLLGVSRASFEELLEDYHDFIRNKGASVWLVDSEQVKYLRRLAKSSNENYDSYRNFFETRDGVTCANIMISLVNQVNFLLDRQIRSLEKRFVENGGIRERMSKVRSKHRNNPEGN